MMPDYDPSDASDDEDIPWDCDLQWPLDSPEEEEEDDD